MDSLIEYKLDNESREICMCGYDKYEAEYEERFDAWTLRGKLFVIVANTGIFNEYYEANGWTHDSEPIVPWMLGFYDSLLLIEHNKSEFGYATRIDSIVTQRAPDDNFVIEYHSLGDMLHIKVGKPGNFNYIKTDQHTFIERFYRTIQSTTVRLVAECKEIGKLKEVQRLLVLLDKSN